MMEQRRNAKATQLNKNYLYVYSLTLTSVHVSAEHYVCLSANSRVYERYFLMDGHCVASKRWFTSYFETQPSYITTAVFPH